MNGVVGQTRIIASFKDYANVTERADVVFTVKSRLISISL